MNETQEQLKDNQSTHLLDAVKTIWKNVGDALNDNELTCYLQQAELPMEAGFNFLSFSGGYVTLAVPKQNPADWYLEGGGITPQKEKIVQAIAKKYEFLVYKPVDDSLIFHPQTGSAIVYHHFALADRRQNVIVAHPFFLKICLFGKPPELVCGRDQRFPLPLGSDLLVDISPLYYCSF